MAETRASSDESRWSSFCAPSCSLAKAAAWSWSLSSMPVRSGAAPGAGWAGIAASFCSTASSLPPKAALSAPPPKPQGRMAEIGGAQ